MELMLEKIFTVLAPILLVVIAGYVWIRLKQPWDKKTISALVIHVAIPALVISHLGQQHVSAQAFYTVGGAAILATVVIVPLCWLVLKFGRLPMRPYLGSMSFTNVGSLGLSVCLLEYGAPGLALGLAYTLVIVVALFTLGMWIPEGKIDFSLLLRMPVTYGMLIALVLVATGIKLPVALDKGLGFLGQLMIPLQLFTLGCAVALLRGSFFWRSALLCLLRTALAIVVVIGVSHLLGLQGVSRGVFIIQATLPAAAVTNYLLVDKFDEKEAPDTASYVLASTLLSLLILPPVLAYWV